jgi:hypothetical protein
MNTILSYGCPWPENEGIGCLKRGLVDFGLGGGAPS